MVVSAYLSVILCYMLCFSYAEGDEPFSFRLYNVLQIVSKIESKIEKWETEREIFQENVLSVLEHRRNEMKQFRDEITNITGNQGTKYTKIVAFNAYTTSGGSYGDDQKVIFPKVLLNKGEGYNKDTGIFTAPVSGLYYFSAHICHLKAHYMVISIVQGDKDIAATTERESVSTGSCSSVSAPAVLKAGECVFIRSPFHSSKMFADKVHRWPSFTGVLVQVI